ncbi:MAG: 4Fe-4S dicluster domain-containing protein [Pseudomonadota bacterium]
MHWFIKGGDFNLLVDRLIQEKRVVGPVAKKTKFVFEDLRSSKELRLDHDVTIIPPKKAIFPTTQNLFKFDGSTVQMAVKPIDQVLLGVHFYDVKAIDMLDQIFSDGHPDENYLAQRERTTLVASNIQKVSPRAFFATVATALKPNGHDAFLTKLPSGFVFETRSKKGEALLSFGKFRKATQPEVKKAGRINENVLSKCREKLTHTSEEIAKSVRGQFGNELLWKTLSKTCFSCGTCNIVCPTCQCFDVQDDWNVDQKSGVRYRTWDACQTQDFALETLGAGGFHNSRPERFERYRHRALRKTSYLIEKLGGPACVGCGRCSVGCVPDIADPVRIVEQVMES